MKITVTFAFSAFAFTSLMSTIPAAAAPGIDPSTPIEEVRVNPPEDNIANAGPRVQIALLLDTSNSMDGLIDQAKTQLWKVVNTFIDARRDGKAPVVEVALYEYGNNDNAVGNDWVRLVSPMTRDLDSLSRELFALDTNGGEEYCGAVIQRALGDLSWDDRESTYKVIFVAGNEPFTQGRVDARAACKEALSKNVIVNTIHCGNRQDGISGSWHDGAALAGGDFLIIDQDKAVAHVDAPQDKRISELGRKLNRTYLGYGHRKELAAANQLLADVDAAKNAAAGAPVQRAVTKASVNYSNAGWDLCDAVREGKIDPAKLEAEDLPAEMRELPPGQRAEFIKETASKRALIQEEIKTLNREREAHVASELKKLAGDVGQTLDQAMIDATRRQASSLGYKFGE